jgi:alpha-tubulin suppressor-like RCC1 family protein
MRSKTVGWVLAVGVAVTLPAGCGDDDGGDAPSPADMGTMAPDSGPPDSGSPDTGVPVDLGRPDMGALSCTSGCAIVDVTAGVFHTCARRENGQVLCWGSNYFRELGDNVLRHESCPPFFDERPTDCSPRPVVVASLAGAMAMESGGGHITCASASAASWSCWGLEFISTGTGQPAQLAEATPEPRLSGFVRLGPGGDVVCGVRADGSVGCYGDNRFGQLGDGTRELRRTPVAVSGLAGVAEARTRDGHSCAVKTDGTVLCWGNNESGQLGDGVSDHGTTCRRGVIDVDCVTTPVEVSGLRGAAEVALTRNSTCARKTDGTVWCWGASAFGQLGNGTRGTDSNVPVQVSGVTSAAQLAAGSDHVCARLTSGAVVCWGRNFYGQLGDDATHESCVVASDTTDCSSTPVTAMVSGATDLAAGGQHTCAVVAGGVTCWGYNVLRQAGQRGTDEVRVPTALPSF